MRRASNATGLGRHCFTLRAHLVALSLALLLPALCLGGVVIWLAADAYRTNYRDRMQDTAHALALAVDREVSAFTATLVGMATSRQLDDSATTTDRADFFARAKRIGDALGTWVVVFGPGPHYQMRVNTHLPFGVALPAGADLPALAPVPEVFETGQTLIGGVAIRKPVGRPVAVIVAPVERDGQVIAAISMPLDVTRIQAILRPRGLSGDLNVTVTDDGGNIVARSSEQDRFVGKPIRDAYRAVLAADDMGFLRSRRLDGTEVMVAFAAVPSAPGWRVSVSQPVAVFATNWDQPLELLTAGGFLLVAAGVALAMLLGRRLLRPLVDLAAYAEAIAARRSDGPADPVATYRFPIAEYEELRVGFVAAGLALRAQADSARRTAAMARASEAKLAASEARLARAITAARIGTWEWDARTDVLTGSDGREALYGLPPGGLANRAAVMDCVHPEDRALVLRSGTLAARSSAASGNDAGVWRAEFRVVWPDGTIRWISLTGRVELAADGTVRRTSGAVVDVTDRREAENELARLNRDLTAQVEEEIGRRQTALMRAAQAERMQVLGQLAGGIAHDFNNVLQGIQGAAALIEQRPGDPLQARRLARLVLECAGRGASVTRRLLSFARRGELAAEAVDVADLLGGMRAILAPALGSTVTVQIEGADQEMVVLADKSQLETALLNLATNARDAMEHGGTLIISASAETVAPAAEHPARLSPGDYVRLCVSDTGGGIDAEIRDRIFEPFFTTKAVGQGTGLGLPMAKGFAEQSGGGLDLISEPGRGTTVRLWLPRPRARADGTARDDSAGSHVAGSSGSVPGRTLLLVDDDDFVRETVASQLEDAGHAVLPARGGAEALGLLDSGEAVDLLITDLSMAEMDGLALIRAVHDRHPDMPVVLLTGFAGDAAALAVDGATSARFSLLQKPVSGRQLVARVTAMLAMAPAGACPVAEASAGDEKLVSSPSCVSW